MANFCATVIAAFLLRIKAAWPSRKALLASFTKNNAHHLTPGNIWHRKEAPLLGGALSRRKGIKYICCVRLIRREEEEEKKKKSSQTSRTVNEGFCLDWISETKALPLRETFILEYTNMWQKKKVGVFFFGAKVLWCWVMSLHLNDHWWQTHKASFEEARVWNARAATLSAVIIG